MRGNTSYSFFDTSITLIARAKTTHEKNSTNAPHRHEYKLFRKILANQICEVLVVKC